VAKTVNQYNPKIDAGKKQLYDTVASALNRLLDDAVFSVDAQVRTKVVDEKEVEEELRAAIFEDYETIHDFIAYALRRKEPNNGEKEIH
jgi:hypothetical protein